MQIQRTIIAGGGPGGLALARRLQQHDKDFVLLESRAMGAAGQVGLHGTRENIVIWNAGSLRTFRELGVDLGTYIPPGSAITEGIDDSAQGLSSIGRAERDLRQLVLGGGGDVRFSSPVTAFEQVSSGGVRVGVGGTTSAPASWIEGSELANFTGGRTGLEATSGLARTPLPGNPTHAVASWDHQPHLPVMVGSGVPLVQRSFRGFNTELDGLSMALKIPKHRRVAWRAALWARAQQSGIEGSMRGAQLVQGQRSFASSARRGDHLAGGETVSRTHFTTNSGANSAVADARRMASALQDAAASPHLRDVVLDAYDRATVAAHRAADNPSLDNPDFFLARAFARADERSLPRALGRH